MNALAVAFSGPSNSGKTTTILKVVQELQKSYKLAIIKHDPADKASFDKEGKDSYRFYESGAEVVVASPTKTTYFSHESMDLGNIIKMLNPFDILIVEGLKTLPLPRISIFRNKIDESYFPYSKAIAIDGSIDLTKFTIPKSIDILDLNDTKALVAWILKRAKKIKR